MDDNSANVRVGKDRFQQWPKDEPLISILSPVYNEGAYVSEMVDSVRRQTHHNWELLIVDDGSTDDTWKKINDLSLLDPRVKVVGDSTKKGKVAAFNIAFEEARGDAIVLLGGDDTLPASSIEDRAAAIRPFLGDRAVVYFRLRTMSEEPQHNNIVIPKRLKGNRSGGTMVMSRHLAQKAFPIPADLVAEDIWLSNFSELIADIVDERPEVVLSYRIHANNSNPRHQDFARMNDSIHARMLLPFNHLLTRLGDEISQRQRSGLLGKIALEEARYNRKLFQIVFGSNRPLGEKMRALAMSHPVLFTIRTKLFRLLSGWG